MEWVTLNAQWNVHRFLVQRICGYLYGREKQQKKANRALFVRFKQQHFN